MESLYKFQALQFAVKPGSLHLLRNGFNYKTIELNKVSSIEIKDGFDMKNWPWVLIVGLGLTLYALYDIAFIFGLFNDKDTRVIYVERLVIPVIPLLLGIYSIVIALRKTKVMIVAENNKNYYLSLRDIIKAKKLEEFTSYMQQSYGAVKISY